MSEFQEKVIEEFDSVKYEISELNEKLDNLTKIMEKICKNTPSIKKIKKVRAEGEPKRNISAYFWFQSEVRKGISEANEGSGVTEISKLIASKWSSLDPNDREKYNSMAAEDKERYVKEMEEWKAGTN